MADDPEPRAGKGGQARPGRSESGPRGPETGEGERRMSRRELLKGAGLAGAAAFLPRLDGLEAKEAAPTGSEPADATGGPSPERGSTGRGSGAGRRGALAGPLHNLTAREAEILEAVVDRLIPADEHGPGALDAGAIGYIDRALSGPLSDAREAYRTGLEALDRYARYSRSAPFVELSATDQDSILFDLQGGGATGAGTGFEESSATFFYMVRSHTWQAMFGDPSYGGNQDFAGWSLVGYPGLRLGVTPEVQRRLEAGELEVRHRSAYDLGPFR